MASGDAVKLSNMVLGLFYSMPVKRYSWFGADPVPGEGPGALSCKSSFTLFADES